jgi:hypothetical protein
MGTCLRFESSPEATFLLADQGSITPIVIDGHADQSVHIAVATFAEDIYRVTGHRPAVLTERPSFETPVIEVRIADEANEVDKEIAGGLVGKWESFLIRVEGGNRTLALIGSDKVGRGL